jgi:hypothetical protein
MTKENAPSRFRLRPEFRLTAAEATADRNSINLWRPVLGAKGNLEIGWGRVKDDETGKTQFADNAISDTCGGRAGETERRFIRP